MDDVTAGLFRAAICESGTVLTSWSYQRYARDIAYQTATAIDSSFTKQNTSEELLKILQNASAKDIQYVAANNISVPSKHVNSGFIFAPVIESGDGAFLTENSYEALEKGDFNSVPLIIGMNSEEAIEQAKNLGSLKKLMRTYDNDLTLIVNDDFHIENDTLKKEVGEAIRKIYTEGLFEDDLASSVRFISDSRYTTSIIKFAQILSDYTNVFFYQFSYDGQLGNIDVHIDGAESVAHSEELQYLWENSRNTDLNIFPDKDVLTQKRLIKMWTNFVVDMYPTTESIDITIWPLAFANDFQYLDIREDLQVKEDPKGDVFKAWDNIYKKYGIRPFDTY